MVARPGPPSSHPHRTGRTVPKLPPTRRRPPRQARTRDGRDGGTRSGRLVGLTADERLLRQTAWLALSARTVALKPGGFYTMRGPGGEHARGTGQIGRRSCRELAAFAESEG